MRRPGVVPAIALVLASLLSSCSGGSGGTDGSDGSGGPGDSGDQGGDGTSGPAGPEPVVLRTVDLPAGVTGARFPSWSADGGLVLFSATPEGGTRDEVMAVAEDGSGAACLSCGVPSPDGASLLKPLAFPDGRRVAVRVGEQSPVAPSDHGVLECTPSVADCRHAVLVPLEVPAADDPGVAQAAREVRVSPDGETVGFTQVRRRPEGDSAMVAAVGRLRRAPDGRAYTVEAPRVVSTLGELKNFTPDGRGVLVAAFTTLLERAANPDVLRIDLATGEQEPLTLDGDYDEDVSLSPDQDWYVVASGRGSGLFEAVSQVRRPNFLGEGLAPLTAYLFAHHRRELLEPWVVRVGAEADGERGQLLNPDSPAAGYDARTLMSWHPDGDRVLFWEGRDDPFAPPRDGSRLVVAHLPDRTPATAPAPPSRDPAPSPDAAWAPALEGYVPPPFPAADTRDGRSGGTATVTREPGPGPDQVTTTVRYEAFSDDGDWVVDGTESTTHDGGLLGGTTYTADLRLSGAHEGHLHADATLGAAGITGTITSEVDGRTLTLPAS